jgi:hypothetical protein
MANQDTSTLSAHEIKALKKLLKKVSRKDKGGRKRKKRKLAIDMMMHRFEDSALVATLGSAPAFATAESMITASQAQGQMMLGAVANQQRLNTLGLIATGECVMQMMNLGENVMTEDEDDDDAIDADLLRRVMNPPMQ